MAYWLAQWITAPLGVGDGADTNRLGASLHVLGPARADETLFGAVPSVWLQARLVDGSPHWYDVVAALVYVTHFVTIPLITAVVWFRLRDRFGQWLTAVLAMSLVGIAGYLAYPAAPPWLAAQRGDIGTLDRISHLGWEGLGLDAVGRLCSWASRAATRWPRCRRCTPAPHSWRRCSCGRRCHGSRASCWRRTPWRWR